MKVFMEKSKELFVANKEDVIGGLLAVCVVVAAISAVIGPEKAGNVFGVALAIILAYCAASVLFIGNSILLGMEKKPN